jgi:hypothetical protein
MRKQLTISIPQPCHENWENMTLVEQGRFCGSCQKKVIDFSRMSDRELAMFFKKPSSGNSCGRFLEDQLDRSIDVPRKRIPWIKYFFQFLLPGFLFSMRAIAQGKPMVVKTEIHSQDCTITAATIENKTGIKGEINASSNGREKDKMKLTGTIYNDLHFPIPFATIIFNNHINIVADSSGNYEAVLPQAADSIQVRISAAGHSDYEAKILGNQYEIIRDFILDVNNTLSNIIVSTDSRRRRIVGAMSSIMYTTDFTMDKKNPSIPALKLYPNPVKPGEQIHFQWGFGESGDFRVQVFSTSGQLVFTKEIYIDHEARVISIDLPVVGAGEYFVKISGGKKDVKTAKLVIN